ncbi:hypothetical protein K435DRAFT_776208 [Dendrothele bispora CBS 962.96]|uniref:Secreted protein n=1 Tax=Dendrothele bispora (strain CBS 962.96) TaxID=1314807 RepID=A0A4S8MEK5_DENBC|nr:hypothetical protein K435DRAFT_776208 [Dendrothele bispora CBS 962.96]
MASPMHMLLASLLCRFSANLSLCKSAGSTVEKGSPTTLSNPFRQSTLTENGCFPLSLSLSLTAISITIGINETTHKQSLSTGTPEMVGMT